MTCFDNIQPLMSGFIDRLGKTVVKKGLDGSSLSITILGDQANQSAY